MPPPKHVALGPLTRTVLDKAVWRDESEFPAHQAWADDTERVLSFLETRGMLEKLLPRLWAREREGTFAEARTAYFFSRNGFQVLRLEPEEVKGRPGDLEIQWLNTEPIFVEIKGPGWEAELSTDQLKAGRQHQPKHIHLEARAVDPVGPTLWAIDKALPKLSPTRCNLVVLMDDLFISPVDLPQGWLPQILDKHLAASERKVVSGVYILNPVSYGEGVEYRKFFHPNRSASRRLPGVVVQGLLNGNNDPQGPRWSRA